jgi:NitT/TauT family transport system ATP-binding protein
MQAIAPRTNLAAERIDAAPKLAVQGVSKSFNLAGGSSVEAVKDMNFDVRAGESCALLGPSGCGKSTVLRMVAGLERPTSGAILLDGVAVEGPGRDRAMVFQSYTSFDWLTVQENVEYGMRINAVPPAQRRERAQHFIELVRLTKFRDAYPKELSGGMKQRVAIARTLANDPAILLMDEPFGALDAETRWHMQELMVRILEASKTTVVIVTHDLEEAIFLADRIVFMTRHPGRVREVMFTEFKRGRRILNKEDLIESEGFHPLEKHLMQLMRSAVSGEEI